jgi:tRNA threonylcarbamoyladenosine biosynthesis protein TsaB
MCDRWLVLETSGRVGHVAVAEGGRVVAREVLSETRRHGRDLAPAVGRLLAAHGWNARDLTGVMVSRGPGSFTGLRVGIASAKTFAYAARCSLVAVDTFAAVAEQSPPEPLVLDVIADAQQGQLYVERFARAEPGGEWRTREPLAIRKASDWLATLPADAWVSGPGVAAVRLPLPDGRAVAPNLREPGPESVLSVGLRKRASGVADDPWTLEPLYLRGSSAEEKARATNPAG